MGVKLKITSKSEVKPQNEDCYLSQISEKTIVRAMIVGAVIVGAMIVGAMIVGAMIVGAMIVGAMIVGAMRLSPGPTVTKSMLVDNPEIKAYFSQRLKSERVSSAHETVI